MTTTNQYQRIISITSQQLIDDVAKDPEDQEYFVIGSAIYRTEDFIKELDKRIPRVVIEDAS